MTTDKTLEISHDADFNRYYIPLPGGWEVQTKGRGSSFRIANTKDNKRLNIPPSPYLFELLERMAREILAAYTELSRENADLRESLAQARNEALSCSELKEEAEANYSQCRTQVAALQRDVQRLAKLAQGICPSCGGDDLHSALIGGADGVSCCDCDWSMVYPNLPLAPTDASHVEDA